MTITNIIIFIPSHTQWMYDCIDLNVPFFQVFPTVNILALQSFKSL